MLRGELQLHGKPVCKCCGQHVAKATVVALVALRSSTVVGPDGRSKQLIGSVKSNFIRHTDRIRYT